MMCAESVFHVEYICCEKCGIIGSVSDPAELSEILDLPLNKDTLFKDSFAMESWLSLSKDINKRRI